jgi:dihydroneopterin aldolase
VHKDDKITLKNMLFAASIGVADWERDVPTIIEVDVEIDADLRKACTSDNLHDTINYSEVYESVCQAVESRHHNLLESLAHQIAEDILARRHCRSVTVRIRKPNPPIGGVCAFAEVQITRGADQG